MTWKELLEQIESIPEHLLDNEALVDADRFGNTHLVMWVSYAGNEHPTLEKNEPYMLALDISPYSVD
jgi:hypothetical protein